MAKSSVFQQLVQSSLLALAVTVVVHGLKLQLATPDREPSQAVCRGLADYAGKHQFESFSEFYPYYLCEHSHHTTKLLHFIGTFNAIGFMWRALGGGLGAFNPLVLLFGIAQGYAFAWVSHFFVEQNKPATFQYPVYSFASDFVMLKDLAMGAYRMW